eukprot:3170371-Prymnesium_polylepis.1
MAEAEVLAAPVAALLHTRRTPRPAAASATARTWLPPRVRQLQQHVEAVSSGTPVRPQARGTASSCDCQFRALVRNATGYDDVLARRCIRHDLKPGGRHVRSGTRPAVHPQHISSASDCRAHLQGGQCGTIVRSDRASVCAFE